MKSQDLNTCNQCGKHPHWFTLEEKKQETSRYKNYDFYMLKCFYIFGCGDFNHTTISSYTQLEPTEIKNTMVDIYNKQNNDNHI